MFNPGQLLAEKEIIKGLPKGPSWFSLDAILNGETNKVVKAFAGSIGNWINAVYQSRRSIYLSTATGTDLDLWGLDVNVARRNSETDDSYRARINSEILARKLTKPAIEGFIEDNLGLEAEIYLPWQDIAIYDYGYDEYELDGSNLAAGLSGVKRFVNEYYTAGVIDVQTIGWHLELWDVVNKLKGAPIKPYFTPKIQPGGIVDSPSTDEPIGNYIIKWTGYAVQDNLFDFTGEQWPTLSGIPDNNSNTVLIMNLVSSGHTKQKLWDSPWQSYGGFRYTSQTGESIGDLTWNQALEGYDAQVAGKVVQVDRPINYSMLPGGSFETYTGFYNPDNWVTYIGGSGATTGQKVVDKTEDSFWEDYVTEGNRSYGISIFGTGNGTSRVKVLSHTTDLTGKTRLALDVFTGGPASMLKEPMLDVTGYQFGRVLINLTRVSDSFVENLWFSTTPDEAYNLTLDVSGRTGNHVIECIVQIQETILSGNVYSQAFFDNVRIGEPA